MSGGGKGSHRDAHFGSNDLGGAPSRPGDGVQGRYGVRKRVQPPGHFLVQSLNLGVQASDALQLAGQNAAPVGMPRRSRTLVPVRLGRGLDGSDCR